MLNNLLSINYNKGVKFVEPQDTKNIVKWAIAGGTGFTLYNLFIQYMQRSIKPSVDLKDQNCCIHYDRVVLESLIYLQSYRSMNRPLFKSIVKNIDKLMFLEDVLIHKKDEVPPVYNDKILAFMYYRDAINHLNEFQFIIKENFGPEHLQTVDYYVEKIYYQLIKRVSNVFHICYQFKPDQVIKRAKSEVKALMKNYKKGIRPSDPRDVWKRFEEYKRNQKVAI